MPTYEYFCAASGEIVEVRHSMTQTVRTWGELCRLLGREPDSIAEGEPVERLLSGGMIVTEKKRSGPAGGSCCGIDGCHPGHR